MRHARAGEGHAGGPSSAAMQQRRWCVPLRLVAASLVALCGVPIATIDPASQVGAVAARPPVARRSSRRVVQLRCFVAPPASAHSVCAPTREHVQGGENVNWKVHPAPEHLSQLLGWKDLGLRKIKVLSSVDARARALCARDRACRTDCASRAKSAFQRCPGTDGCGRVCPGRRQPLWRQIRKNRGLAWQSPGRR